MRSAQGSLQISAADLSNHLACDHLTVLDLAAAEGRLEVPYLRSGDMDALRERGLLHERAYLDHLESQGLRVTRLDDPEARAEHTLATMRDGADVIYQAPLGGREWYGRADILRRVERPSELGPWSYEAHDTKLARETRGGTILQLCLYSELIRELQGTLPQWIHVVPPGTCFVPESLPVIEYMAYFRLASRRLKEALASAGDAETCPDPVSQCEMCRWWPRCDSQRRRADHLSFVAGISRLHMRELRSRQVLTLASLAEHPIPFAWKPERGTEDGYVRLREQARVQQESRTTGDAVHERLPLEPGRGLARLPAPSSGDVFLDLEGDPFVPDGGLEYLFGLTAQHEPDWHEWAFDRAQERAAFERLVDTLMERWARHPDLHVYHFAPYEPAALKRLMGRYATRESEIDRMLRAGLFVDLHAVVRQALRAGVERYSLKDLEVFHGFAREEDLDQSRANRHTIERAIESGSADLLTEAVRQSVLLYNREDCVSTMRLRDWLERLRGEVEAGGTFVPRPVAAEAAPSAAVGERDARVSELMKRLTRDVHDETIARSEEQQGRWLLAHMLDWHRREEKVAWWEFFRLSELDEDDLLDERDAIAGLEFLGREGGKDRYPIHRYRFPRQETSIREEHNLLARGMPDIGTVEAIDVAGQTVDIRKTAKACDLHPRSVFTADVFPNKPAGESLLRLGEWVADQGVNAPGPRRAARDLLLRRPARFVAGGTLMSGPGEDVVALARRLATRLDRCVLPIQGPPGSGKTFIGAHMIVELVRAGRMVGVSATSHKVIRNLLNTAMRVASDEGVPLECVHKAKKKEDVPHAGIVEVFDNDAALAAVRGGSPKVLGGTSWLWSREEFFEAVDVLIVDEAGQMSLADVLAIAQAANSVVLLGDPQQLDQPVQGSHPPGTEISALEHLLGGARTITSDRGIFLAETRRLAPALCHFTSEVFYEGRLKPLPGLDRQVIVGDTAFAGAGLWFVPVTHDGNRNASAEEVNAVAEVVRELTSGRVRHVNDSGAEAVLGPDDVLVVAPYNAQVADLRKRLPGMRVGTVDKFQGQEAAVVIYSLTTSSPDDAPRGMEFLYDLNRLNVATSRARCACIIVGSPRIFEPECQTPRQMQLANALCRFLECATERQERAAPSSPGGLESPGVGATAAD